VKLVASKLVSEGRKREPVSGKASVQKHAHLKGNFVEKQEIFHRLPARNVAGNNVKRTFKHKTRADTIPEHLFSTPSIILRNNDK